MSERNELPLAVDIFAQSILAHLQRHVEENAHFPIQNAYYHDIMHLTGCDELFWSSGAHYNTHFRAASSVRGFTRTLL